MRSASLFVSARPLSLSFALALGLALLFTSRAARADRELLSPFGGKGTIAIDQLSGFRASSIGGISYAGPLGYSTQSFTEADVTGKLADETQHASSFWVAPSLDIFPIDHLSIGALVEVVSTSRSVDVPVNGSTTQSTSLPTTTDLTILPRVGWLFAVTDRFGVWPRVGAGYASHQSVIGTSAGAVRDHFSALAIDIDIPLVYRVNETFFLKAAPELTFTAAGSHSNDAPDAAGTVSATSASGSAFALSFVSGIGVFFDL